MHSLEVVLALVLGASLVTAVAAKSRAPAPSLLVIAGLLVALIPGVPVPKLTPDLVLFVVLPPLLSSAAEEQNVRALRAQWKPVTFLAVGLVIISAALTALVAAPLLHVSGPVAFVLGTILASTDPVAVTALARQLRLPERLESIIQAESLANDATSLVLFSLGLGLVADGGGIRPGHLVLQLFQLAGGGALAGAAVSLVAAVARRRTSDPIAQTVLALVTPYAAYVAANAIGAGGVTAVVVAGVITGELVNRKMASEVRVQLRAVNGTIVFLLETVIFALIGLQIPDLVRAVSGGVSSWLLPSVILAVTLVVIRFLGVSPLAFFNSSARDPAGPSALQTSLVATWAGTRGVVPLAAALSLPLTIASGAPFPARNLVLLVAASVVVLTLTVQGLTLAPLTRRTGVAEPTDRSAGPTLAAREVMQAAARARLDELNSAEAAPVEVLTTLEAIVSRRERSTGSRLFAEDLRALRLDLLSRERSALDRLHLDGEVTDVAWRSLSESLDLQVTALLRTEQPG